MGVIGAGGRAFFYWLVDLPWKRVGVWFLVTAFAFQLKDFFGVSLDHHRCQAYHTICQAFLCKKGIKFLSVDLWARSTSPDHLTGSDAVRVYIRGQGHRVPSSWN